MNWEAILGGALAGIGGALGGAPPPKPTPPPVAPISQRNPVIFFGGIGAVVVLTLALGFMLMRKG